MQGMDNEADSRPTDLKLASGLKADGKVKGVHCAGQSAPAGHASATTTQQTNSAQPKSPARIYRLTLHDRFTSPSVYNIFIHHQPNS
ncbi:hypothetical protein PGT21_019527 [Puccinia graminis f. sp. tritici]|uniref:Uncharacterized protein n=1 Tax=Puccinia graminis f. sp. tritici TaxID=56615 RepID=A0A5B0PS48_PUCGR|nr:hypothetical protein PGT21_019527 [Puccinia graminis f. sp. tritici]KAA1112292.1 hypothetical protein PGTUg99_009581 [Puccinia graminis f. sp. tritici]